MYVMNSEEKKFLKNNAKKYMSVLGLDEDDYDDFMEYMENNADEFKDGKVTSDHVKDYYNKKNANKWNAFRNIQGF